MQIDDPIHVISIDEPASGSRQKPPDYEAVADAPPSYDDAIKLNPSQFLRASDAGIHDSLGVGRSSNAEIPVVGMAPTPPPPYARCVTFIYIIMEFRKKS